MISIVTPILDLGFTIESMTRLMVKSLLRYTMEEYELILVHNGPVSFEIDIPGIITVKLPEREGIGKAYNEGFKVAQGKYFCCLHNDVEVSPGWSTPLTLEADRGNIAFPLVDDSVGNCELRGVGAAPKWTPPSCCMVMQRQTWDKIGGYDEGFEGLHCEDLDLFTRATEAGVKLVRVSRVTVLHWRGMTRSLLPDGGSTALGLNLLRYQHKWQHKTVQGFYPYPRFDNVEGAPKYLAFSKHFKEGLKCQE